MEKILILLKEAIVPIATCILSGIISYIVSVRTANKWVPAYRKKYEELRIEVAESLTMYVWGDRIFEKCGIGRDEGGDGGKTLEIRGKRRLSARDRGANYQQS
jgi:hypothetical protein